MFNTNNFNENLPNRENIDVSLSKILFYLTSASMYDEYKDIKRRIDVELDKFLKILNLYTNNSNLLDIKFSDLDDLAQGVSSLDCETVDRESYYLEMADVWISILIGFYENLKESDAYGKR